tara:strand:- start:1338 stop:2189 length:852 start_codon:yes stop_codon:yes gene_type:complete
MDIEDWYHLDYFDRSQCDKNYSLLDGINTYREILQNYNIPSSFFVLSEIAESISSTLREIVKEKNEIGSHGWDHVRPMTISKSDFYNEIERSKKTLEDLIGTQIDGYRAPCFSIDRQRLDLVQKTGFSYDSSRIDFSAHPLYETINMDDFELIMQNIYRYNDFFEFQASTISVYGKNMPISGGGYIRLLPWFIFKRLLKSYMSEGKFYVLYIHPFELSSKSNPSFPPNVTWGNRLRFGAGRSTVSRKLSKLIELLKENDYRFTTFSSLRKTLLSQNDESGSDV